MNTCRETGVCLMESNCQSSVPFDTDMVEAVAKALAGEEWEATSFNETLSGDEPEEMREYWREKARDAIRAMRNFTGKPAREEGTDSVKARNSLSATFNEKPFDLSGTVPEVGDLYLHDGNLWDITGRYIVREPRLLVKLTGRPNHA